jgi:hypothetical protein
VKILSAGEGMRGVHCIADKVGQTYAAKSVASYDDSRQGR